MSGLTIRMRLVLLVSFMAAALLTVGGIGLYAAKSAETDIQTIYEHQVLPMREIARIRRLIVDNGGHMFRAMQHNPAIEYSKLHDHPVTEHLSVVKKNLAWMDETYASLHKNLLPDSEELRILKDIEAEYAIYLKNALGPAMAALEAGNYSQEIVAAFLKGNRAFESKINPLMREIAEAQEKAVKTNYEHAVATDRAMTRWSIAAIVLGLVFGLGLAFVTIRSITGPMHEMQQVILRAANDDFTGVVQVSGQDEVAVTAGAFNELMTTLRQTLGSLRQSTVRVDDATSSLATAAQQASIASSETSSSASSMAASVEELSVSITSVSDSTREALDVARSAGEHSETGGAVIANAVNEMAQIADQVRVVGNTITVLGDHSNKISSVVQVIKDVADQTNLLALNAAIEAARAGEAGRGFAVVADEVRKLAERTTSATGEIAQMISAIQGSAQSAVGQMDETIERLHQGSELAAKAGEAIVAIQQSNSRVFDVVREISNAMGEQGAASQDIAQRVERVAQASEESSASVGVSADAARDIHQLSADMRRQVERFRV